jgi:hypothetical protein
LYLECLGLSQIPPYTSRAITGCLAEYCLLGKGS